MIRLDDYARLLGYPPRKPLEGAVVERAEQAIAWYRSHGRPRVYVRHGVAAITAGIEADAEIARRWRAERVDEAYFLDRLAAAVVEHLARDVGVSPGRDGWSLDRHRELAASLGERSPVALLPSGMLRPVHSMLAAVTGDRTTCPDCSYRCAFRRTV